jgi:hypothetical protein
VPPLSRRQWLWLALASTAVFTLSYLTPPDLFGAIDWVRIHVFYKRYAAEAVRRGQLPLWNPYVSLGRPFLADVDAATLFYPPNLPYLFLPPELACAVVLSLHLGLAGYGALRLAVALGADQIVGALAGLAFVLSAPIVGSFHSGLIHYGPALCYLPLVLTLALELDGGDGRCVLRLGLVLGLQLLAGHPQAAWLTWLGAGVLVLLRRPRLRPIFSLGGAIAIACLLAAVTLLPLAELTQQSNRGRPSLELAGAFSEPSFGWASLLVPSDPAFSFLANAQLYVGIAPLLLAILAMTNLRDRTARALAGLGVFAALLAAGQATPIFRLFYAAIPGVASLRLHSRASVLVSSALICLAVIALGAARDAAQRRRAIAICLGTAFVLGAAQVAFVMSWPGFAEDRAVRVLLRVLVTGASAATICAWLRSPGRASALALGLCLCADLGWAVRGLKPQNRDLGDRPSEAAIEAALRADGRYDAAGVPPRISMPRPWARENAGMSHGWSSYTGYAALTLDRVWYHVHATLGLDVPTQQNTTVDRRVFLYGPFPFRSMSLGLGMDPETREIVAREPDPRVYVATAVARVADHRAATAKMAAGHDFVSVPLVESDLELGPSSTGATGRAHIESFAPERVVVRVDSPAPGLVVLGEAYYPGWTATIAGRTIPCIPANAWMRAAPVPAGISTVVFAFHSRFLGLGAAISIGTLILVVWILRRRR